MANITTKQYGSVSLHGGIIDIMPRFCATIDNVAYGTTTKVVYWTKFVHVNEKGYLMLVGNREMTRVLVKNLPLQNMIYIEPIVTTQGN